MRSLSAAIAALTLTACVDRQQLVVTRHQVVMPESSLFSCQRFTAWPEPATLTSSQVAMTILDLYQLNEQCYASQEAVRKFLQDARARLEAQPQ